MERYREKLPTASGNESESSRKSARKTKLPPGTDQKIRDIFSTDEDDEEGNGDGKKKRKVRHALVPKDPVVIQPQTEPTEPSGTKTPQHTPAFLVIAADIGTESIKQTLQEQEVASAGGLSGQKKDDVKPKTRPNPFTQEPFPSKGQKTLEQSMPPRKIPLAERRKIWKEELKKQGGKPKFVLVVEDEEDDEIAEVKEIEQKYEDEFEAEDEEKKETDRQETPSTGLFMTTADIHAPIGPDVGDPMGPDVGDPMGPDAAIEDFEDDDMDIPLSGVVADRSVGESSTQVASTWFASVENVKTEDKDEDIKSDTSSGEVEIMKEENVFRWDRGGVMEASKHCVQCLSDPDKLCEFHKNILRSHVKSEPTPDTLLGTLMSQINVCPLCKTTPGTFCASHEYQMNTILKSGESQGFVGIKSEKEYQGMKKRKDDDDDNEGGTGRSQGRGVAATQLFIGLQAKFVKEEYSRASFHSSHPGSQEAAEEAALLSKELTGRLQSFRRQDEDDDSLISGEELPLSMAQHSSSECANYLPDLPGDEETVETATETTSPESEDSIHGWTMPTEREQDESSRSTSRSDSEDDDSDGDDGDSH